MPIFADVKYCIQADTPKSEFAGMFKDVCWVSSMKHNKNIQESLKNSRGQLGLFKLRLAIFYHYDGIEVFVLS